MFGPKMFQPTGPAAVSENQLARTAIERVVPSPPAEWAGQTPCDWFRPFAKLAPGTRRPLAVAVPDLALIADPAGLRFQFTLPSGCYATTLLREFQKPDSDASRNIAAVDDEPVSESDDDESP